MRQTTIWTAAAGATFGFAANAAAAPATYDIVWTSVGGSTGSGFFTIDDSLLVPGSANDITDLAEIDAFGATFVNVPGFGTLSFDLDDLTSVTIKIDDAGQQVEDAGFNSERIANEPYLFNNFSNTTLLIVADGTGVFDDTHVASYNTVVTARTTEVPEPGTLALLAAGAAALPLLRRRRRRAQRKAS